MSAVDAHALAAWTSGSASFEKVPAAAVTAWLLERGAPVDLLVPESSGATLQLRASRHHLLIVNMPRLPALLPLRVLFSPPNLPKGDVGNHAQQMESERQTVLYVSYSFVRRLHPKPWTKTSSLGGGKAGPPQGNLASLQCTIETNKVGCKEKRAARWKKSDEVQPGKKKRKRPGISTWSGDNPSSIHRGQKKHLCWAGHTCPGENPYPAALESCLAHRGREYRDKPCAAALHALPPGEPSSIRASSCADNISPRSRRVLDEAKAESRKICVAWRRVLSTLHLVV